MFGLIYQMQKRAEWHARRMLMGAVGVIFVAIGGGFGVAAAWMAIVPHMGAIGAALIIGAIFGGVGLLILAIGSAPRRRPAPLGFEASAEDSADPSHPDSRAAKGMYRPSGMHPPLMEAFLLGLSVYLETKNGRR